MPSDRRSLKIGEAVALGVAQGPTELLPVSSSGHTTVLAFLLGWPYGELDPGVRKEFEVALHAGAGLALALDMRSELAQAAVGLDRRRAALIALSLAPPAAAGYALEETIERRFAGPRSVALGLLAGAIAMAVADRGSTCGRGRRRADAGAGDGLALGLAQVAALVPGVSRNGATLTAARARGFARAEAEALSWHAGLPVILAATALQGARLVGRGPQAASDVAAAAPVAGAASAFFSTLLSARLLGRGRYRGRSLLPYALYRCTLAGLVLLRLRGAHNKEQ